MEAISGNVYGESAEVSAIVTILHDRTEAIEREQLYEQLKAASAQLERRVQEATAALVRQNELLRRQAIELEQASVAKSQFLANVSHDVRTPLNAILGYTSLLLRGVAGALAAPQRDSLVRVDANARHLLTLIKDILDISRIEAGKMPVRLSPIRLQELVDEIISEVEPLIATSNLTVTATVPDGLPVIRSDRQKVKQILLNLLTNALKFTPRGSVTVSCSTSARTARSPSPSPTPDRHRARGPGAHLRGVLPGRLHVGAGMRRHRSRPRHLPAPGVGARRPDHPREQGARGLHIHPGLPRGSVALMTRRTGSRLARRAGGAETGRSCSSWTTSRTTGPSTSCS